MPRPDRRRPPHPGFARRRAAPAAHGAGGSIAAVLIARDEARCIARCLDSVRPWVDRILLLDTGSSDDTVALAERHGAEVHHRAWPGDFAAARNHALVLADADWNLVIDADEWIDTGGDGLRGWCAGPPRLGTLCVHSAYDAPGARGADAARAASRGWLTRLLPRGVRYRGRVHEQIVSTLSRERLDLHLGHDGYRDAQMAAKRHRNRPLLLLDLHDHPGDPYILYQLGKDAEIGHAFAEACDHYAAARAGTPHGANWRHELVVRHLHCLGQAGRAAEALRIAEDEMERWPDSPDLFFVLGNLLLDRAVSDPAQAMTLWLPLAGSAWERCLEIGECPDLEGSVHGRGSHLARHNLDILRAQMATVTPRGDTLLAGR